MAITAHTEEKDLLFRLQGGDHMAFDQLYDQYSKALYWKLQRMVKDIDEAEELLQELFIKVWERRSEITIQQSFKAYLYRVAQRMAIDYFRRLERENRLQDEMYRTTDSSSESTYEYISAKETQRLLDEAIAQLPEQRQRAFILCKIEGKSHQEAAEIMGISPNTVHNHLVKAVGVVRLHLDKAGKTALPIVMLIAVTYL